MDWINLVEVLDNDEGTLRDLGRLAVDAGSSEQLGDKIRDMIRKEIPENGGLADQLWTQAQQGISYRRVGEYYWEQFRDDEQDEETEADEEDEIGQ